MQLSICQKSRTFKQDDTGSLTFDITVQLLVGVQIVKAQQQLPHDDGDIILADHAGLHEIGAAPAGAELHDDPKLGALGIGTIVLRDIWGLEFRQDGDFLDDILDLILSAFDVDDLDCYSVPSAFVDPAERKQSAWVRGAS